MRYIMIPLLIIVYIIWTVTSIRDEIYAFKNDSYHPFFSSLWVVLHGFAILLLITYFSYKYW
jgi:hypothetical protein